MRFEPVRRPPVLRVYLGPIHLQSKVEVITCSQAGPAALSKDVSLPQHLPDGNTYFTHMGVVRLHATAMIENNTSAINPEWTAVNYGTLVTRKYRARRSGHKIQAEVRL